MNQEIKLPDPDTHCWDDEAKSPRDVWSYSPALVRKIIEADRAQRGEPAFGLMTPEAQDREASLQDTAPQPSQPKRKPMPDNEMNDLAFQCGIQREDARDPGIEEFARAIEAFHGIKP